MKVIQILYSGVGGTSSVAFSLTKGDLKKKWKHVFAFIGKEKLAPGHKQLCKKLSISFYNYEYIKNFIIRELILFKLLVKEKPDSVVMHGFNIFSVIILKKILGYKAIFVEHTPFAYRNVKNYIVDFFVLKFFDKIILLSKDYRTNLIKKNNYKKKKDKIIVVNNGISSNFYLKPPNFKKRKITIGMLSRFSKGKCQDKLILSFNKLLNYHKNFKLYLVGEGDNLVKCKTIVNKLAIQNNVKFLKSLKLNDIHKWFAKIDIYVHLSEDEGLSTAILYAIELNRPVLATKNIGNNFLRKKNGDLAILVENNINNIVNEIKKILSNEKKIVAMIKRSKKEINKNYSSESMFKKYNKIINEI